MAVARGETEDKSDGIGWLSELRKRVSESTVSFPIASVVQALMVRTRRAIEVEIANGCERHELFPISHSLSSGPAAFCPLFRLDFVDLIW